MKLRLRSFSGTWLLPVPLAGVLGAFIFFTLSIASAALQFNVTLQPGLVAAPQTGRLFVILARTNQPEPRATLTRAGLNAPYTLARDTDALAPGATAPLDRTAFTFPITNLSDLPAGDYFVQALLDSNRDLRSSGAPGNLYSDVQKLHLDPARSDAVKLKLTHQVPPEQLPPDTAQLKFIKFHSRLLTDFYHRPISLRAGVILPRDYARDPARKYPHWVRIGGLNARYTSVTPI